MDDISTDFKARIGEEVKYLTIRVDRLESKQDKIAEMLQTLLQQQERIAADLENHTSVSERTFDALAERISSQLEGKLLLHEKREEQKINQLLTRVLAWVFGGVILPAAGFFAMKIFGHFTP